MAQHGQMGTNKLRILIINCYWRKPISMRLCFIAERELLVQQEIEFLNSREIATEYTVLSVGLNVGVAP